MDDSTEERNRVGLVISGGGAKGAYAFGCLVALKRAGYKFDCIAGTSAGALNAALLATGSLGLGFRIWRELSFSSIYPVKLHERGFPKWMTWMHSLFVVFANLIFSTLKSEKNPATKPIALVTVFLNCAVWWSVFLLLGALLDVGSYFSWMFDSFENPEMAAFLIYSGIGFFSSATAGYTIFQGLAEQRKYAVDGFVALGVRKPLKPAAHSI